MPSTIGIIASHVNPAVQSGFWLAAPRGYHPSGPASQWYSTPHAAAVSLTGDLEAVCHITWRNVSPAAIMSKWATSAGSRSWSWFTFTSSTMVFWWYETGGTLRQVSVSNTSLTDGTNYWLKVTLDVDNGAGGHGVSFWRHATQDTEPAYDAAGWTQIGSTVNAGAFTTSLRGVSGSNLAVGADGIASTNSLMGGIIKGASLYSGIGASRSKVAGLTPETVVNPSSTTFTGAGGETWTINNPHGYPAITSKTTAIVVCEGDSLTYGNGPATVASSYPRQMAPLLDGTPSVIVTAYNGEQASAISAQIAETITPLYRPEVPCVAVVLAGTNDIGSSGDSAATTWGRVNIWCDAMTAAGWKVVLCTLLPRADAGRHANTDTSIASFNTTVRADWATYADALADIAADPSLDDPNDTTYFNADKLHLTAAGYLALATVVAGQINTLI